MALNRDAEYDGLMFWSNGLENYEYDGASIARGFFCSKEFINRNLSNEEFIATLYRTFFNREADPEGWNCWIGVLNKGYSRTYVLSGFVNSKEFANLCDSYGIARGTMEQDGSNIYNAGVRNFVLRNYTKALGRTGETEGVEYWCHLINTKQTTALDVAQAFFHSKEFQEKNLSNEQSLARNEVLRALNEYRVANGVGEVTWDYWIEEDAMYRAAESMIYPGHTPLTERWDEHSGRSEVMLSNNMWVDLTNEELADNIIEQFDRSPAHKAHLLYENVSRVGIGIATNGYGYYVIIRLSNG